MILPFTLTGAVAQPVAQKVIQANGAAAGDGPAAREKAVNRALRAAVEQGVGTFIDSGTMVENFQLIQDRILSEVKGYVSSYDVIKDNQGQGGVYRVTVQATVVLATIESDLRALNLIREMKGNPRVMVIAKEGQDGLESKGGVLRTCVEQAFLKHDFPLVDVDQLKMVRERDAMLNTSDQTAAVALAKRYGAEILVLCEGQTNFGGQSMVYGINVFAVNANVTVRAIKTDTAQVMASEATEATAREDSQMLAGQQALTEAGTEAAKRILKAVSENMRSEAFNTVNIEVVIQHISSSGADKLVAAIKDIHGVAGVYERSYIEGNLILDVKMAGSIFTTFRQDLEELTIMEVKIVRRSQNRIVCTVVEPIDLGLPEPAVAAPAAARPAQPAEGTVPAVSAGTQLGQDSAVAPGQDAQEQMEV